MSYFFAACVYKINSILLRAMKLREGGSMTKAFTSIYNNLEAKEHKSKLHILDNECSLAAQHFLEI